MRTAAILICCLSLSGFAGSRCAAPEKDVQQRIKELLAVLEHPKARGEKLTDTVAALEELENIGVAAAPQLVDAATKFEVVYVRNPLVKIGKPALPAIRSKWANLDDERRWRLMPIREKHDRESVREYAWNCLDAKGAVRSETWMFMVQTKNPRAKKRYFEAIAAGKSDDAPYIR